METAKSDCVAGSALTKRVQTAHAQLEPWPKRPPGGQSSSGCNLYRKRILHIRSRKRSCRNKIRQRLEDLLFRIVPDSKILPNHDASVGYRAGSRLGRRCLEPSSPLSHGARQLCGCCASHQTQMFQNMA